MSMTENKERIGAFTSSEIYRLCGKKELAAPALTYIEEKQIEIRMNRSISVDAHSQAMAWGTFMEMFVFDKIGKEYIITSNLTDKHPTIEGWTGSKDLIVEGKKISDIKCYYPKKFAKYTDAMLIGDTEVLKAEFAKEYWQLVSNAIINKVPNAEAITFMPYESELEEIREMVRNYDNLAELWKYRFIEESPKSALPYLPENGYYKNINKFEFEVPKSDIDFLTERVELAIKHLRP